MVGAQRFESVRLEDYQPPAYEVDHVELRIELDPDLTRIETKLFIVKNVGDACELDGVGLVLEWVKVDGTLLTAAEYQYENGKLVLFSVPTRFELEICSTVSPRTNQEEMGLFERRGILATECEPYGFRRLSFFPDRPDVLTTYRVTLIGDPEHYPVMLSNGNLEEQGTLDDGRSWVTWNDPVPKPSYIFAVFAGKFGCLHDSYTTGSGRLVDLNIYIEESLVEQCAHGMASLKRALRWDEQTYGFEYDLDLYNVVALVGHGNAMENKGLNLFAAEGIVADKETTSDEEFLLIERIIAHEVFHNWTGNRVTCRDWFQLCLKEGLTRFRDQTYDQSLAMGTIKRIWQVKALRRNQFPQDDGPNAHAVRPHSYYTVENFYNHTVYDKGAEIVRMLCGLLGESSFIKGVRLFVERYDLQAVTLEDFLASMAEVSGRDLRQFARWYDVVGRPRVLVEHQYDPDSHECELRFTQTGLHGTSEPMVIPVAMGLVSADGAALKFRVGGESTDLMTSAVLEVTKDTQTVVLQDVASEPIPSLLRGFSAPVSLEHGLDRRQLSVLATMDSDPYARWDSMQRLYIGVIREVAAHPGHSAEHGFDEIIVDCVRLVLADADTDKGLAAELLDVADEPNLSEGLASIDLDGLMAGRTHVIQMLAQELREALLTTYRNNQAHQPWSLSEDSISRRMLKNACLRLLASLDDQDITDLCYHQLTESDCMTDRFAALTCLINTQSPERDTAIEWAYRQWKSSPMLLNYWFKAQALARTPDVIERLKALLEHPAYDATNTAHAMALLGTFFRQNRVAFHDPSGAGYEWLADVLLFVDTVRPAGTAWLMPQINQWGRYDENRKQLMRMALKRVASTEGISKALFENVTGALGGTVVPG